MDELDMISDAEFFSTEFRLLGKQLAHVDAGADDAVVPCPSAQHLPRTAAEVNHSGAQFQTKRRAESGKLFRCERVVDAVFTLSYVEYPWYVPWWRISFGLNRFGHGLTAFLAA